jgi:intracellular sulfur oxidation DsrE/DsrF family protein
MKNTAVSAAIFFALTLGACSPSWAQARQALPIPGVEPARDVPGAREIPDSKTDYKVLFDVATGGDKPGEVNPTLQTVARYVNTLAKVGVPAEHRKIAVIFHQGATPAILKDDAYKARNNGQDNPNIAIIQALKKAEVELHVCGQAVLNAKIDPKDIQPEIQLDLWALTTIVNMQLRGYQFIR